MKSKAVGLVGLAAILWLLIMAYGCENSVGPGGGARDYTIYFGDISSEWKFGYHPATHALDSFIVPGATSALLTVSADGKRMFVRGSDEIIEYDLGSGSTRVFWPRPGEVVVSPDGRMAAIFDEDFQLIDLRSGKVLYFDTARIYLGSFSNNSRVFYGTHFFQKAPVIRLDLTRGVTVSRITVDQTYCYALKSLPEGEGFFLLSQESTSHVLACYDWWSNSRVYEQEILPGFGDIQLSPDAEILYISNPGPLIDFGGPEVESPWTIVGLDTRTYDTLFEISTIAPYDGDTLRVRFPVGPMAITPDGKWLLGVCGGRGPLISVDLHLRSPAHAFKIGSRYPAVPAVEVQR